MGTFEDILRRLLLYTGPVPIVASIAMAYGGSFLLWALISSLIILSLLAIFNTYPLKANNDGAEKNIEIYHIENYPSDDELKKMILDAIKEHNSIRIVDAYGKPLKEN